MNVRPAHIMTRNCFN